MSFGFIAKIFGAAEEIKEKEFKTMLVAKSPCLWQFFNVSP
jgi:hypothetical protein